MLHDHDHAGQPPSTARILNFSTNDPLTMRIVAECSVPDPAGLLQPSFSACSLIAFIVDGRALPVRRSLIIRGTKRPMPTSSR